MTVLASISGDITDWIAQNGVYAVFVLMAVDALFPAGGELIMLYAGALASGSISGHAASLFGVTLASGAESYVVLAAAGTLGYLLGALVGWAIGRGGGRTVVERHGRRLHVSPESLGRAERWFERYGLWAVFLGRLTPVVRSFISIPAGVFRSPLPAYASLTLLGSAIWCFGFAAAGWALGGSWESFHESFRYADYAVAVAVIALGAFLVAHRLRSRGRNGGTPARLAEDPQD
ncbi:MAG TPA: DedA family protein [Solirubrobacterales bacterium]|nr:DedA family protein [Solirubrobacterales bacterium]